MSGELVGEVIRAAAALEARGLHERGFHALVAIAEKCHHQTRQGSVPWTHIRAGLYGVSKRTAERAVLDLKKVGVLRVVKSGFNNNNGRVCAPIYQILSLTDTDTYVSESRPTDTDTQMAESTQTDTANSETDTDKTGDRCRHSAVVLNGSINGSKDGGGRIRATPSTPAALFPRENEPPRYCPKHMPDGTHLPCRDCGSARQAHESFQAQRAEGQRRQAAARRQAIDACSLCSATGFVDVDENTVKRCDCNPRNHEGAGAA